MVDFFNKWKEGLERTRKVAFGRIASIFGATQITDQTWDELEAILIQADMGLETTESVIKALKAVVLKDGLTHADELQASLRAELEKIGIPCTIRIRRGIDIQAGCGQLAIENNPPE